MKFMVLNDIIKLGNREAAGRGVHDRFVKESGVNAMAEIAELEGRGDDPAVKDFVDMAPTRQRGYLEETLGQYQGELRQAVLGDLDGALSGFTSPKYIGAYLLNRQPTKVRHELGEGHKRAYEASQLLQNREMVEERVGAYISETVGQIGKDVKGKKITGGLGNALAFVYQSNRGIAFTQITGKAHKDIDEFNEAITLDNGRSFMSARIAAMNKEEKAQEAYVIGRTVTDLAKAKK